MSLSLEQSQFLQTLRLHLIDLSRRLEQDVSEDVADYVLFRLEQVSHHLSRLVSVQGSVLHEVYTSLAEVRALLRDAERQWQPVCPAVNTTGFVGRPKFEIGRDQLLYLVEYDLKVADIAEALGVSSSTIKRRLREYDISLQERQSDMTDNELDSLVQNIQALFPNAGYRRMQSQLNVRGIKVSQIRVRESMRRTDPEGVAMRRLTITPRAVYCVSGPLALWHIDGNHKLIR